MTVPNPEQSYRVPPATIAPVCVVDIDMPMSSMTSFMVKWAIAAIPALILLMLIALFLAAGFLFATGVI